MNNLKTGLQQPQQQGGLALPAAFLLAFPQAFLTACGALLFALIGITAIIRNVTSIFSDAAAPTAARANAGFGIGPYGS